MASPREYSGRPASEGIAIGPAHIATVPEPLEFAAGGSVATEKARLADAITRAVADLTALRAHATAESADIVDVQVEMLEDPELIGAVVEAIEAGSPAAAAWTAVLDRLMAEAESDDDEAFPSRAADFADIRARLLAALSGESLSDFPKGSVFLGRDIAPSVFLAHDWSAGGALALSAGSPSSHVAMLARSLGVPMAVGLGEIDACEGEAVLVDGTRGTAIVNPPPAMRQSATNGRTAALDDPPAGPLKTADGEPVRLWLNVNSADDLNRVSPEAIAGIGLVRTEFLIGEARLLDEDFHFTLYRQLIAWAQGRPVTVRLLDLGGDKPAAGLSASGSAALGLRGARLLLARPDVARPQIRALLRAAGDGDLRVLVPVVTVPAELDRLRQMFMEEAAALGNIARLPQIGMMVEVPAAALTLDLFGNADFFSFGTNDLGQYLAAAAREETAVADLLGEMAEPILRLLAIACGAAARLGRPVSICGDMAGDPDCAQRLLVAGLRDFSVAPTRARSLRHIIPRLRADGTT